MKKHPYYSKIIVKLSGELLNVPSLGGIINIDVLAKITSQILIMKQHNVCMGLVIGGGNILRGDQLEGNFEKSGLHYAGMMATIVNAMLINNYFNANGVASKICSVYPVPGIVDNLSVFELNNLIQTQVIIFAGGTGMPFLSTDSCAALRALEINADLVIKATEVGAVYSNDPKLYPEAEKFSKVSFEDSINNRLNIMDLAAFSLCHGHNVDIFVCNPLQGDNLSDSIFIDKKQDIPFGTMITND